MAKTQGKINVKRFVAEVIKGTPGNKAVKRAGSKAKTDASASQIASRLLRTVKVQTSLTREMEKQGIDDKRIAEGIRGLLDATKPVSAIVTPGKECKDANAGTVDFVDVPDYNARARGLDMANKLRGSYIEDFERVIKLNQLLAGESTERFDLTGTLLAGIDEDTLRAIAANGSCGVSKKKPA